MTSELHDFLLQVYLSRINCLFPILQPNGPPFIAIPSSSANSAAWQEFMRYAIYSIACRCVEIEGYRALSEDCYMRALEHFDRATTDTSIETLQAITLLALYSFFAPQAGNTGQLIGFAARMVMDIERHDCQDQHIIIRRIYTSIYAMENQLATALDRPGLLLEPVCFFLRHPS